MQFDHTRLVIRERPLLDTCDLALLVLREYPAALLGLFALGVAPLFVMNDFLIGWMLDVEYKDLFFYTEEAGAIWRYWWVMTLLVVIEAPLASIFMTSYLGQAVFVARPHIRQIIWDVLKMLPRVTWCQLLVRGVLLAWVILGVVDRYGEFDPLKEILFLGAVAMWALGIRAFRPFINEIILLERNPLTSRKPLAITVGRRSSQLHGPSSGDLFARWLGTTSLSVLLTLAVFATLLFVVGVFLNDWIPGPFVLRYVYPLAMWTVAWLIGIVRFLNYLDLRIRHEGWEVELRLRAEAARQAVKLT